MGEVQYYIVVPASRGPTSCVILAALVGALTIVPGVSGRSPELAALPLLPAEEVWQIVLPDLPAAGGALDADRVYLPLASEEIVAIARTTGAAVWTRALASRLPPIVREATLYVAAADALHALNPATGRDRWQAPLRPAEAEMLVTGDLVLVPVQPAGLVAVRRGDGQPLWTQPLDGALVRSVTAADGTVYVASVGSGDAHLTALAAVDGQVLWSYPLDGEPAPPTVAPDRVFVGTAGNLFYAFHPTTGRLQWRWALGGSVTGAAADDDRVYVTALDNLLRGFNRGNGHQRWRQALSTRPLAPPRQLGQELLVTGVDPALSTFLASTGAPVSTYSAPALLQGAPLLEPASEPSGVHIVIVLRDGRVVGLRPAGHPAP